VKLTLESLETLAEKVEYKYAKELGFINEA
jgi:hypothetical protein